MTTRGKPGGKPHANAIKAQRRRDVIVEDVEEMVSWGRTWQQICATVGLKPGSLERSLTRSGRPDLLSLAKGDLNYYRLGKLKLEAKARLGLRPHATDAEVYRAVILSVRAGELIPPREAARRAKLTWMDERRIKDRVRHRANRARLDQLRRQRRLAQKRRDAIDAAVGGESSPAVKDTDRRAS